MPRYIKREIVQVPWTAESGQRLPPIDTARKMYEILITPLDQERPSATEKSVSRTLSRYLVDGQGEIKPQMGEWMELPDAAFAMIVEKLNKPKIRWFAVEHELIWDLEDRWNNAPKKRPKDTDLIVGADTEPEAEPVNGQVERVAVEA